MRTHKYAVIGLIMAVALLVSGCAGNAAAQSSSDQSAANPRVLNVTGNGKVYLEPDIAFISIGVHTENKDAAEAVTANNATSKKVSDALSNLNVDSKDIRTSNFNIYPQQIYDMNGKVEGILYIVENTVYVTVRDLDKISSILGRVIEAGANSISGIQFDVDDKSAAFDEAREAAVEDARTQAQALAKAAGVTLGDIQNINVYNTSAISVFDAKGIGGGATSAATNVPINPGQLTISVDVNIVFEIK